MTGRDLKRAFAAHPSDAEAWVRKAKSTLTKSSAKGDRFTARLTIDVTPGLRSRIKIAAFRRGITIAQMLRDLLSRHFPDDAGDAA
ncbi:MAG: hypothetical protein ACREV8_13795 [Gammaproteobacteria bacterium]